MEKTGGGSLNIAMGMELGDEPDLGEETGGADAAAALHEITVDASFPRGVGFNKKGEIQFTEDVGREGLNISVNGLRQDEKSETSADARLESEDATELSKNLQQAIEAVADEAE
jgi:hypothetical protein